MLLDLSSALAADLLDLFAAAQPLTTALPDTALRLEGDTEALPSPRIVFLTGEPARVPGMDGTARVQVSIEVIASLDRAESSGHGWVTCEVDSWLRAIRLSKRRAVVSTRVYLHDLYCEHAVFSIRSEQRELCGTVRAEAVVTLLAAPVVII